MGSFFVQNVNSPLTNIKTSGILSLLNGLAFHPRVRDDVASSIGLMHYMRHKEDYFSPAITIGGLPKTISWRNPERGLIVGGRHSVVAGQ